MTGRYALAVMGWALGVIACSGPSAEEGSNMTFVDGATASPTDAIARPGGPTDTSPGPMVDVAREPDTPAPPAQDDAGPDDGGALACASDADCDDEDPCTGLERCTPEGTCIPGEPPNCDDGDPCTFDGCVSTAGGCVSVPDYTVCGDGTNPDDTDPPLVGNVDEAVALYDAGTYSKEQLLEVLEEAFGSPPPATTWAGTLAGSLYFPVGTYEVSEDVTIASGTTVVLTGGVTWRLQPDVTLTIEGRMLALGDEDAPIQVRGEDNALYDEVAAVGGPSEFESVQFSFGETLLYVEGEGKHRIHRSAFDAWSDLGLDLVDAQSVHVTDSEFGLATDADFELGEAVHGDASTVWIERSRFGFIGGYRDAVDLGDCELPDVPVLAHNHFMGGEDDAIDLDNCTAIVVGNLIENYRPEDLDAQNGNMNGGGITGAGSSTPLVANNVIQGCFHGVGFKDGAEPILIHNTITNNHVGVTFYQSEAGESEPHGTLFNNILWDNRDWADDTVQDVLLHGRWWPGYNQEAGEQATLEASYNLVTEGLDGEGNVGADPLLEVFAGYPFPTAGSPAVDTGGDTGMPTGVFAAEEVWTWLQVDALGQPRPQFGGMFASPDRGAIENQP